MKAVKYKENNEINTKFLSAVSHELRAPLTAIKGYATMLLEYYPGFTVDETKEYIQSIDNATDRMTRLVDRLLDVTRLEEGRLNLEKTPIDIANLIKAAVKEAEIRNSHHEMLTALENDLPKIHIDPNRIRQVLDDLFDNAVKRSPKGTEILISARANDHEIEISVTSRDPGIPGCEFCNIPELLYKMEQIKGSGTNNSKLELYICQRIIEAHGGRVWAESIVGKGTAIKFTLPLTS
jgi:K+-sensing histidine kinase KdpD